MAIYSAKHAKELIGTSICLDESSSQTGIRVRAVLKGELRERVFHVCSLLADGGKKEIQDLVVALRTNAKAPASEGANPRLNEKENVA